MQVLIIGYVWPEPNSSAAGSRMMQLINAMTDQNWSITFASPAQHSEHAVDLESLGVSSQSIELNNTSFDGFVAELAPNMVIFDRFMMEEQFGWRVEKFCPNALRVLNTEDLHSLREARHKALKKNHFFDITHAHDIKHYLHSDLALREIAAIHRSDLTLMISQVEVELLVQHFQVPKQQLMYLPFMLPALSIEDKQQLPSFEDRTHFISIGNFRHAPNWDIVLQLKQSIWPLIRKQLPDAELHIYGAYPPPKATQLHNAKQGFHIKGWAEDAKAVMKQARICLAPIRFGAGIKGKLTDAMICGTPSITTDIGSEGMAPADDAENSQWSGEIISAETLLDNPQQFADSAVSAYNNEQGFKHWQKNGFDILHQQYDKRRWQIAFISRLNHQHAHKEAFRHDHFLGLMLRHHSMKSTQYMAQWIEAKNR